MLRVLIVGCGNIAGRFDEERPAEALPLTHAGAYRRDDGFDLVGCVDPDAERRAAFAAHWQVPWAGAALSDWSGGAVDVVSICSPTACHRADVEAALALNPRLIFCEKPVTPTAQETAILVSQCEDAGVALAVNHTRRWAPDVMSLRQEIAAGHRGRLLSAVGTYTKGIVNNGSHLIDLLHFLLDSELRLIAAGRASHDHDPRDPTVPALLETADGAPVQLAVGDARDYARFELELAFAGGTVTMEDGGLNWRDRAVIDSPDFAGYRTLGGGQSRPGRYAEAMMLAVANIRSALERETPLASTGQSALRAQQLCETIRAAARGV